MRLNSAVNKLEQCDTEYTEINCLFFACQVPKQAIRLSVEHGVSE